jgi:dihydrofolate reductase
MISMIVATDRDWVIGRTNGEIPWKHRGDQKLFKELTMGHYVVMGRNTWGGIPSKYRPLAGRTNVVITTTGTRESLEAPLGVEIFTSVGEFIKGTKADERDVWLIGGRRIYEEGLEYCDKVHITRVPGSVDEDVYGDPMHPRADLVYLPDNWHALDGHDWTKVRFTHPHNKDLWVVEYKRVPR